MQITLKETLKLEVFKEFKLLTGKKGLGGYVTRIGLLDHEMINPIKGQFVAGEFALSTLLAAKDEPELIYTSVAYLIESGASGLGVKDIYYETLPVEVLKLAEDNDFPIFMFNNNVYFEDIITEFKGFIDALDHEKSFSDELERLIIQDLDVSIIEELFYKILGGYSKPYQIIYLRRRKLTLEESMMILGHRLKKRLDILFSGVYREGLFVVTKQMTRAQVDQLLIEEDANSKELYYGISNLYDKAGAFKIAMLESLVNARIADVEQKSYLDMTQRGLYQLLIPYRESETYQAYCLAHIHPLLAYDASNGTMLVETVRAFVQNEGQIKSTATALRQHSNTIRYRLSKVRQVLEIEGSDSVLYERLSLAIKLMLLDELDY